MWVIERFRARRRRVVSGVEGMIGLKGVVVIRESRPWAKVAGELWQIANPDDLSGDDPIVVVAVEGLKLRVEVSE